MPTGSKEGNSNSTSLEAIKKSSTSLDKKSSALNRDPVKKDGGGKNGCAESTMV